MTGSRKNGLAIAGIALGTVGLLAAIIVGGTALRHGSHPQAAGQDYAAAGNNWTPGSGSAPSGNEQLELVKSGLRNTAYAEEEYYTDHDKYADSLQTLAANGMATTAGVTIRIVRFEPNSYCLAGDFGGKDPYYYNSIGGGLTDVACS